MLSNILTACLLAGAIGFGIGYLAHEEKTRDTILSSDIVNNERSFNLFNQKSGK